MNFLTDRLWVKFNLRRTREQFWCKINCLLVMFTDHFSFSCGLDLITRQPQVILLWVCLMLYLQSLNFNNFPLSKVIRDCIASVLLCSDWSRKLEPFLSPIRSKTKTEWWLGHSHFTALPERLRVLVSLSWFIFHLFWLALTITSVLVFWQLIRLCSISKDYIFT